MMFNVIVCSSLFFSVFSWSGPRVTGNGGDGVVCRDGRGVIKSVRLLDYYEAQTERNITPRLGQATTAQNTAIMLGRLQRQDAILFKAVMSYYTKFESEMQMIPNANFEDIPDSQHLTFPPSCRVEQMAVQRPPIMASDKYYFINQNLWNYLPAPDRAGLILHEVLYRIYLDHFGVLPEVNSRVVRLFVALLAADRLKSLSSTDYESLRVKLAPSLPGTSLPTGLIGVPLYRTFVEERVPFTIEMLFTERATVIHKVTCHFSQLGRGDDIVATVEVPVKVDVKFVEHLDWKEEKIFTRSRLYFCKSTIMKMKTSYFYLDDNHVSIGDQVWTRK